MIKTLLGATTALILGACASTPAWKHARSAPPLTIPAGVDAPGFTAGMVVPKVTTPKDMPPPRSTRPPASDQLTLTIGLDAAYQRVGAVLEHAKVGHIVSRDAAARVYRLELGPGEVKRPPQSFWHRVFHHPFDTSGEHYALVSVERAGGGQSAVLVSGDDLAVNRLYQVLEAATVSDDKPAHAASVPKSS